MIESYSQTRIDDGGLESRIEFPWSAIYSSATDQEGMMIGSSMSDSP
jgi:hypothetical protein